MKLLTPTTTGTVTMRMWLDSTEQCRRCFGTGNMAIRTGYFLLDIDFVRCEKCNGSGITGELIRIM